MKNQERKKNLKNLQKKINDNFLNKYKGLKEELGIFDISAISETILIGSCIKRIFFKTMGFSRSDFSLYSLEKQIELNNVRNNCIKKYKIFSGLEFIDIKKLELKKLELTISTKDMLITKDRIFLFKVVPNTSDFKSLEGGFPPPKDFPAILSLLIEYPSYEIVVIYKSLYGKNEIFHEAHLENNVIIINGTSLMTETTNVQAEISEAIKILKNSLEKKEIPKI